MVVFSWAVVSFCIELFCVVTLQYQILVRIAIAYFIIEKKNAVNTKKKQLNSICSEFTQHKKIIGKKMPIFAQEYKIAK